MGKIIRTVLTAACLAVLVSCAAAPEEGTSAVSVPGTKVLNGQQPGQESTSQEETMHITTAMYLPIGEQGHLMVDQENGSVFTVTMPEEIFGLAGERISAQQLQRGNIVEITGNGIMLYSYPGQYPGVSKIQVISQGKPEDADQYQELIDEFTFVPNPAEPPSLNVNYRTAQAVVTAVIGRGSYSWSFTDEEGQSRSVTACGTHVLQWGELNELRLLEATDLTLRFFYEEPSEVRVTRWPASALGTEDTAVLENGEEVEAVLVDGQYVIKNAQAGYVYLVVGIWESGTTDFGFAAV